MKTKDQETNMTEDEWRHDTPEVPTDYPLPPFETTPKMRDELISRGWTPPGDLG